MELGERELRNFVRTIMPELYQIQASIDEWEDAIAKIVASSKSSLKEPADCEQDNYYV